MLITMVFVYQNNISKTILMFYEYKQMKEKLIDNENIMEQVQLLERRMQENPNYQIVDNENTPLPQSKLLDIITQACSKYDLTVQYLGSPINYRQQGYNITLNMLTLQGRFGNITRCIHWLESSHLLKGQVVSVDYKLVKTYRGNANKLVVTLYFQQAMKGADIEK